MYLFSDLMRIGYLHPSHINRGLGNSLALTSRPFLSLPLGLVLFLPVSCKIEADKQQEIGAQDSNASERGKLLTCASARVRHPGEVGAGKIRIGGEIDEAKINDELHNLQHGDILFPPDLDTSRRLEIVPIHNDVDQKVQGNWDPGD